MRLVKTRLLAILNGVKWDMVFAMAGVMVFKDVVAATGFLNEISELMVDKGVPLFIMAILFPFIAGIITGNNGAAIGLTAPLFVYASGRYQCSTVLLLNFYRLIGGLYYITFSYVSSINS